MYQLDEKGRPLRPTADYFLGQESGYGRRTSSGDVAADTLPFPGGPAVDEVHQRLFVLDRSVIAWGPGQRILVFDIHPDRIKTGGDAIAVIGARDFASREAGTGSKLMSGATSLTVDGTNQRLFVADRGNNRVLAFDIHPARFRSFPDAVAVIGQPDFSNRDSGVGSNRFSGPGGMALDGRRQRLFVSDGGNSRILVFDVHPERFRSNPDAIAVLGQSDFQSRTRPRPGSVQIMPGNLSYDEKLDRLLIADVPNNRILAFDVAPERMTAFPKPVGVVGQPDVNTVESELLTYDPVHADTKTLGPRIEGHSIDPENQLIYVAEGYYAGNRIGIFDISPDGMVRAGGARMVDVIGHLDDNGVPSFVRRMANDRVDDRHHYPRSVALDPVDHRLFTIDQYNHRVLVWRLDAYNRLLDRAAHVVIGQPDAYTATIPPPTGRTFRLPGTVAYDVRHKRLFVGDGWYNRVLVFDADPRRLQNFPEAIVVLGQPDATSSRGTMTQTGLNFDVAGGMHGITSGNPRAMGLAVDPHGERLFVSDGPNYRVLVFDTSPARLVTGAAAAAVVGKPDFTSGPSALTEPPRRPAIDEGTLTGDEQVVATAETFASMPGDLVFDPNHQRLFVIDGRSHRVLVFDVRPDRLRNGAAAIAVIGQADFQSSRPVRLDTDAVDEGVGRSRLRWPDGITYDTEHDRLILADKGNDRILFFDVKPDRLKNGLEATAVLGQKDFVSRAPGRGRQDELMDVRGLAFDSEHQRLYATDSFWARLLVFDLARSTWDYRIPAAGLRSYASLDASTDPPPARQTGYIRLSKSPTLQAVAVHTVTQKKFDGRSWRESRVLVSETAATAPPLATAARVFVEQSDATETLIAVANPSASAVELTFVLRGTDGSPLGSPLSRTLGGGGQLRLTTRELGETPTEQATKSPGMLRLDRAAANTQSGKPPRIVGTVVMTSTVPVALSAIRATRNARGEEILVAMPVSYGNSPRLEHASGDRAGVVIPKVVHGGGYRTQIILLNPETRSIEGSIRFFAPSGAPVGPTAARYSIQPNGVYVFETEGVARVPRVEYAVIEPGPSARPIARSIVTLADGDLIISQARTDAPMATRAAWIPLDTHSNPVRHGETHARVTIVNANPVPADVRFTLLHADGGEAARYEMIVPDGQQAEVSLAQLFGFSRFHGTLRLVTDAPVVVTAERSTSNLRNEPISMQIPLVTTELGGPVVPFMADGNGLTTEVFLMNPSPSQISGQMFTLRPTGQPWILPLR